MRRFLSPKSPYNWIAALFLSALTLVAIVTAVNASTSAPQKERVSIVADQEQGQVRIDIDGRTIMIVDTQGVHAKGHLTYTGINMAVGERNAEP